MRVHTCPCEGADGFSWVGYEGSTSLSFPRLRSETDKNVKQVRMISNSMMMAKSLSDISLEIQELCSLK